MFAPNKFSLHVFSFSECPMPISTTFLLALAEIVFPSVSLSLSLFLSSLFALNCQRCVIEITDRDAERQLLRAPPEVPIKMQRLLPIANKSRVEWLNVWLEASISSQDVLV